MRRSIRNALNAMVGFGVLSAPAQAHAGAWTRDAGTGTVIVTTVPSYADHLFNGSRSLQATPRYNKFEFQALLEYGVTDRLTAIISPGLQHVDIASPVSAKRNGLGFSEFGARYRVAHGENWVVSAQALIRAPGTFDSGNPAAIGNNGFEHDFRLLYGYSFAIGAWPAFIDLQLAQRFRSADRPNELRLDAALGLRPAPRWLVLTQLFNVISEGAAPPIFPSYDYSRVQLSVVYDLTRDWSVQGGGFATVQGRNALQENGLVLGVWYKFSGQ